MNLNWHRTLFWIYSQVIAVSIVCAAPNITCGLARLKCSYREGCSKSLENYLIGCANIIDGRVSHCTKFCKKALIGLTSLEEGQDLMRCDCQGAVDCEGIKRKVEVCKSEVQRANKDTVVSCSVAQWICAADTQCAVAFKYYQRFCRSMFRGRKCTMRCNNSISILNRQEKSEKLKTCICDGSEDYDCRSIKANMDKLCFYKQPTSNSMHSTDSTYYPIDGHKRQQNSHVCSNAITSFPLNLIIIPFVFLLLLHPIF